MDCRKWIDRYSIDCKLKYGSALTQKTYISNVTMFLFFMASYREPKEIPTEEIKKWLLLATSFNTRKHRLCAINSFYRITVGMPLKTGKIPFPPKEKKLPRIIDQDELRNKILAVENRKHKALLAIGLGCCLRVSEVVNLKISDILGKQHLISIRQAKGKKDRYTGISETCLQILREYFVEYKPKYYLFEGQSGGQYSTRSCEEVYHKYIDKETSWHNLRHAGITNMIDNDKNILAIGVAVGHSNPRTTSAYYHSSPKFLTQLSTAI